MDRVTFVYVLSVRCIHRMSELVKTEKKDGDISVHVLSVERIHGILELGKILMELFKIQNK